MTKLDVNCCLKLYDYFALIQAINIFKIWPFLLRKKTFIRTLGLSFSCSFHFIVVLFMIYIFLNMFFIRNNVYDIKLSFSQTYPLQLLAFIYFMNICCV
jgi:hypothetical protein